MDLVVNKKPKARKAHICGYCNGTIVKKEIYNSTFIVHEDSAYTFKSHISCHELMEHFGAFKECDNGISSCDFTDIVNEKFNFIEVGKVVSFNEKLTFLKEKYL